MSPDISNRIPVLLMGRDLGMGGTERQLAETARFLKGERFLPHVGCFRPDGVRRTDLENAGVPILHLPVYSFMSIAVPKAATQLIRYIRKHHIQVVHSFDATMNVFAVPVAKLAGVPAVIASQRGHRDLTGLRMKRLLRVSDLIADAIVVNSEAMRDSLILEERVSEAKVRICYNAIDVDRFRRRTHVSTWPGNVVFGVVGMLRPEKGLDTLLRAFAKIASKDAMLLVIGSGPEESRLKALAAEVGILGSCHFEPATADVTEWLSQIDVFVLPSRTEALSNSLMEAMACSCCCIASRVGGNPELIDDEKNGLLFEVDNIGQLAQQMNELASDESRRQRMASLACARMSAHFTYSHAARTMRGIYESVLLGNGPKRQSSATSIF